MDFKHSIYFRILSDSGQEKWQGTWRTGNRVQAADEEIARAVSSGAYLRETQPVAVNDQHSPASEGGLISYLPALVRESASFFSFSEFLNSKSNRLLFKILESVEKY